MTLLKFPKFAYIDGIDWQHHVEDDAYGVKIYPSVDALEKGSGHSMEECGIVKIELREVEWVVSQNLHLVLTEPDK